MRSATRTGAAELRSSIDSALRQGRTTLTEHDAKEWLRAEGIAVPRGRIVVPGDASADGLESPLVLKAISPTLVHKSDSGGVVLGLSASELPDAITRLQERMTLEGHELTACLLEEQASTGHELVLGAMRVDGVGWAVMVGLGGVFVELLKDVSFGVAPLGRDDVRDMLDELRGRPLLDGFRRTEPADVDAFVEIVHRIAGPDGLLERLPDEITALDLNPIVVSREGAVVVDARFEVTPAMRAAPTGPPAVSVDLDRLLQPQSIAVIGASASRANMANLFLRNLRAYGYAGRVVAIHPGADRIDGVEATASLADVDGPIDYAYVALPASKVAAALEPGRQRIAFSQVVSSGFGETVDGLELERDLVGLCRSGGMRLLGPNCVGLHSTQGRVTFVDRAPTRSGPVSVISQSGGLSVDVLRYGEGRGVGFRSVISIGNSADLRPAELVEQFLDDDETQIIGLYLESLAAGREVLDVLRSRPRTKPVVLLAGGRTADGSQAAVTHTGALAGHHLLWPAIARQAGIVLVDTLHEFVDALAVLRYSNLSEVSGDCDVVLFGNGGGTSVLAADSLERAGLRTPRLPDEVVAALENLGLPPGNGLSNPIDAPAGTLMVDHGGVAEPIMRTILDGAVPWAVISHINVGVMVSNSTDGSDVVEGLIAGIVRARDAAVHSCFHLLVLRSDGEAGTEARIAGYEQIAQGHGLPVFRELTEAAVAARCLQQAQQYARRAVRDQTESRTLR